MQTPGNQRLSQGKTEGMEKKTGLTNASQERGGVTTDLQTFHLTKEFSFTKKFFVDNYSNTDEINMCVYM